MDFSTVVVAAAGEPACWVREQATELVRSGLFVPFVWRTHDVDDADPSADYISADGERTDRLIAMVAQRQTQTPLLRVIRLVLPGTPAPEVESLTRRIVNLYPFGGYRLLSLLVPSEDQPVLDEHGEWVEGIPTIDTSSVGREWLTLVASPEDLSPSGPLPVEVDGKLVAHATGALGTVGALWTVQRGDGPFDQTDAEGDAKSAYLLHCTSRSLVADRAVSTAVNRSMHIDERTGRIVVAERGPLPACDDATADDRVAFVAEEWLAANEEFRFVSPEGRAQPARSYVGWRKTLAALGRFLVVVLPGVIVRDIRSWLWRLGAAVSGRLNRRLFDEQSKLVFSLVHEGDVDGEMSGESPAGASVAEVVAHSVKLRSEAFAAAPMGPTWEQTCQLSLSLLDAGPLPSGISPALAEATRRSIIADPVKVLGPVLNPDVLDGALRALRPDLAAALRSGDAVALENVLAELTESDDDTADSSPARRRRAWRLALVATLASIAVGILLWQTPLPSPWNTVAVVAAATVAAGSIVLLVGRTVIRLIRFAAAMVGRFVRWLRHRLAGRRTAPSTQSEVAPPGGNIRSDEETPGVEVNSDDAQIHLDSIPQANEPVADDGDGGGDTQSEPHDGQDDVESDETALTAEQLEMLRELLRQLDKSLVGRIARGIHGARTEASTQRDAYRQELIDVYADAVDPEERESLPRRIARSVARNMWRITRFFVLAALLGLMLLTPLAPFVLTLVVVAVVVAAVWRLAGYIKRSWLDWLRNDGPEPAGLWLGRCVRSAAEQEAHLERSYEVLLDWVAILQVVVAEPFGGPAAPNELSVPLALQPLNGHQVAHGVADEDTVVRMRSRLQRQIMGRGWLHTAFDDLVEASGRAYAYRYDISDVQLVDPFADQSSSATQRHRAPRRDLLRHVCDPASRFALRADRVRRAHQVLAVQGPDELVPGIDGVGHEAGLASRFLLDGIAPLGRPPLRTVMVRSQADDDSPLGTVRIWTNHAPVNRTGASQSRDEVAALLGSTWSNDDGDLVDRDRLRVDAVDVDEQKLLFQVVGIGISRKFDLGSVAVLTDGERGRADVDVRAMEPSAAAVGAPTLLSADVISINRQREVQPLDGFPPGSLVVASTVPVPVPRHDSYAFMFADEAGPYRVALDAPIDFTIRRRGGPADAVSLARDCLQQIADVSGLKFRYQGLTDSFPGFGSGNSESCLWIGWVYPDEDLSGSYNRADVAGMGGAAYVVGADGVPELVPLIATVRAELDLAAGFGAAGVGTVLLHELCHAMNLDHVDDPGQIMFPVATDQIGLGPGDRYGLWVLGTGRTQT